MARSRYEYSTSPRKLEPEYKPQQKQNKKRKLHVVEDFMMLPSVKQVGRPTNTLLFAIC